MQPYPRNIKADAQACADAINIISRLRDQDIPDRNRFPSIFLSGRSVNKIPADHSDVSADDRINDFNVTSTFAYFLVLDGTTPKWGRWAVDVAW